MWLRIISIFFVLVAIIAFFFLSYHQGKQIDSQKVTIEKKEVIIQKDSIVHQQTISKRDSLTQIIDSFFTLANRYQYAALNPFYADTLKKFYKYWSNIPRGQASKQDRDNWSYGNEQATFTPSHAPNIIDDTAYIQGRFSTAHKQLSLTYILQFDSQKKINYIRALYDK